MMGDPVIAYKQAIKAHYQIEKHGEQLNFLLSPTSARLRDLCLKILEKDLNTTDKKIIENFFGLEFGPTTIKKIKEEENRFRRFCNFLKEETDLSGGPNAADFLALLVNYEHRPFPKFKKFIENQPLLKDEKKHVVTGRQENIDDASLKKSTRIGNVVEGDENVPTMDLDSDKNADTPEEITIPLNHTTKRRSKHKVLIFFLIAISLVTGGYMAKDVCFPEKQCMQWQEDHYERVDCNIPSFGSIAPVIALDNKIVHLKRVPLKKGMVFFKYGKPLYYYHKQNKKVEFFNAPGNHPITGQQLNKITKHMINEYVKQ